MFSNLINCAVWRRNIKLNRTFYTLKVKTKNTERREMIVISRSDTEDQPERNQRTRGYWSNKENIKMFLEQFSERLNINSPGDWNNVSHKQIRLAGGRGIFYYYRGLHDVLKDVFPHHDWSILQEKGKPKYYWNNIQHQRKFMDEIALKYNLNSPEDWNSITFATLKSHGGGQIISKYSSLYDCLSHLYPEYHWNPLKTKNLLGNGFWKNIENQRLFFDDIAVKYNIQSMDDWKQIKSSIIRKEGGATILKQYSSFYDALSSIYSDLSWDPFTSRKQLPKGFWNEISNIKIFIKMVEEYYDIKKLSDWYRISLRQISNIGGSGLLNTYNYKLYTILSNVYPDEKWDKDLLNQTNKRATQRWLFICLQRIFSKYQLIEGYLLQSPRNSGLDVELDIYIPELKLAFEYHGIHHYEDNPKFGQKEMYQKRDNEKRIICKNEQITLIEIPYWWNNKQDTLQSLIQSRNISI